MIESGKLDRRIEVQIATEAKDAANDVVKSWSLAFPRWARKQDSQGREFFGADQMIRDADTAFTLRDDSQTRTIAPETHRIMYDGRVFEIVSIVEGETRQDILLVLCASRPDHRGARGVESESG